MSPLEQKQVTKQNKINADVSCEVFCHQYSHLISHQITVLICFVHPIFFCFSGPECKAKTGEATCCLSSWCAGLRQFRWQWLWSGRCLRYMCSRFFFFFRSTRKITFWYCFVPFMSCLSLPLICKVNCENSLRFFNMSLSSRYINVHNNLNTFLVVLLHYSVVFSIFKNEIKANSRLQCH